MCGRKVCTYEFCLLLILAKSVDRVGCVGTDLSVERIAALFYQIGISLILSNCRFGFNLSPIEFYFIVNNWENLLNIYA